MKYCELLEEKDWKLWNKHVAIFYPLSFLTSISLFQLCPILLCILSKSGVTFGRNNTSLLHALYWCTRKLKRQLTCNFVGRQRHKKKNQTVRGNRKKGKETRKKNKKALFPWTQLFLTLLFKFPLGNPDPWTHCGLLHKVVPQPIPGTGQVEVDAHQAKLAATLY